MRRKPTQRRGRAEWYSNKWKNRRRTREGYGRREKGVVADFAPFYAFMRAMPRTSNNGQGAPPSSFRMFPMPRNQCDYAFTAQTGSNFRVFMVPPFGSNVGRWHSRFRLGGWISRRCKKIIGWQNRPQCLFINDQPFVIKARWWSRLSRFRWSSTYGRPFPPEWIP
jgi:hypothetical protein